MRVAKMSLSVAVLGTSLVTSVMPFLSTSTDKRRDLHLCPRNFDHSTAHSTTRGQTQSLLTADDPPPSEPNSSTTHKGAPVSVLCGEGLFSCLCLARHQAHVVITGTEEGCLLLWDLREPASEGRAAVSCTSNPLFQEVN